MSRNVIIGLIVGLVLVVGGAATFLLTGNSENDNNSADSETSSNDSNNLESIFNPVSTDSTSFEAQFTTTTNDGQEVVATIESDGEGNSRYSGSQGENSFETYSLNNGDYITCADNNCFKISTNQSEVPIDESTYEYTDEDFDNLSSNAAYKGKADCPAGTCDLWEITSEGQKVSMYLDSQRRISKVNGSTEEGSYEIVYTYKDVTITAPENVRELPGQL